MSQTGLEGFGAYQKTRLLFFLDTRPSVLDT